MSRPLLFRLAVASVLMLGCKHTLAQGPTGYLAEYCKVWGFLKYEHPNVAEKKVDWDSVFLAQYPKASHCRNPQELDNALRDLLHAAGGVKTYGTIDLHGRDLIVTTKVTWRDDPNLSDDMAKALDSIRTNDLPPQGRIYGETVRATKAVPHFDDTAYFSVRQPDEAMRVLALARYWNVIEYFAPDKYVIGEPWDSVLVRYLPRVIAAQTSEQFDRTMIECCCSIHDSHSMTRNHQFDSLLGSWRLPIELSIVENKVIYRRPFNGAVVPLRPGDEIVSIGGESVAHQRREWEDMVPASNDATRDRNICRQLIRCHSLDSVPIVYRSGGVERSCKLWPDSLMIMPRDTQPHWHIMQGNIGYIDMGNLTQDEAPQAMSDLMDTKAIVFDVRNYPKGTMYILARHLRVADHWVEFRYPMPGDPGAFYDQDYHGPMINEGATKYRGKVILLVNEITQSHAEFTCMLLRSVPGAVVVGSQTAGADGDVRLVKLPGGITTMFSGLGVFYPDGKPTQRVGIVPDVEVHPTIAGIRAGRDEVLEKGIEIAGGN